MKYKYLIVFMYKTTNCLNLFSVANTVIDCDSKIKNEEDLKEISILLMQKNKDLNIDNICIINIILLDTIDNGGK